jgi:hypothetical protein
MRGRRYRAERWEDYIYSKLIHFRIRHAVLVTFEVDQDASPASLAKLMCLFLGAEVILGHIIIAYFV